MRNVELITALIGLLISFAFYPLIIEDYNYQIQKCEDLSKDFTEYGFDKTFEVNAEYSQDCYRLFNYKYIKFEKVYLTMILTSFAGVVLGLSAGMVIDIFREIAGGD